MSNEPNVDDEYADSEIVVEETDETTEEPADSNTAESAPAGEAPPVEPPAPKKPKKRKRLGKNGAKEIELPKSSYEEGDYVARSLGRIDMQLKGRQRTAFRAIYAGLRSSSATLENGKLVDSPSDVIRWIFEQASEKSD